MNANNKRAVEIQFNWIFILIVGALILVFFMMLVNRQRDISDIKLAVELLDDLEQIMTGQRVTVNRQDIIDMPLLEHRDMDYPFPLYPYINEGAE